MRTFGCNAFLYHKGNILLVSKKPEESSWSLPGGVIRQNESAEECVVRKIKEDVGLHVAPAFLVGLYSHPHGDPKETISALYVCRVTGGELRPGSDIKAIAWFHPFHLPPLDADKSKMIRDSLTAFAFRSKKD